MARKRSVVAGYFSLHFAVAPDPVKVYIDETGLYFGY